MVDVVRVPELRVPAVRVPRERRAAAGAARRTGGGAARLAELGCRMWQCGQCSGPASKVRRQSEQVVIDTLHGNSLAGSGARDPGLGIRDSGTDP